MKQSTAAGTDSILTSHSIDRRGFLGGALAGGLGLAAGSLLPGAARADQPKRGGNLRVALLGGGASDTIDAHGSVSVPDTARALSLYEGLTRLDADGKVVNALAEAMEPNADATEWTIRLRKGVKFHDGKPLRAEDVAFTFKRIADPKAPFSGASALQPLDMGDMKVMDDLTLRVKMKAPYAAFPECISAAFLFSIVPVGYDPKNPVGTGPFKYKSFTPGQESVFTRFDDYWQSGEPYLDSVTLIDSFADGTAAFNAVQGGQVDVFASAPLALANQVGDGGPIKRLVSKPGQWTPFTMRTDQAPFDNPDVRMAFRLLVDRQQLVDLSLSGYGAVANDVFSPWDHCFDSSLTRGRDLDQAKHLLKKAGQENMTVELVTSDIAAGVVQAAQVFAQQAKDAGVTVNVRQVTADVFFGDQYLKWPFAQDIWYYAPYLGQVFQCALSGSPFNETHWNNEAYTRLYNEAQATPDMAKRCEILHQMQKMDFELGGYIIPAFNQNVDVMTENVQGFVPAATGISLGNFDFQKAWLA
jgi:peptide/nickel transport system substrate-binding protein